MKLTTKTTVLTSWHVVTHIVALFGAWYIGTEFSEVVGVLLGMLIAATILLWVTFLKATIQEEEAGP